MGFAAFRNEFAALALEEVRYAYMVFDSEFRYMLFNREAERLTGLDRAKLIGQCVWDAHPGILGTQIERAYRRAAAERAQARFEYYHAAVDRWFHMQVDPMEGGLIVGFRDITQEKSLQEELARSKDVISLVSESGLAGSFRWSIANDEVTVSPEMCELYGIAPGEAQMAPAFWSERLHPEDRAEMASRLEACFAAKASAVVFDFRARQPDGSWRWLNCRAKFQYDEQGKPALMVGINVDGTKQKRLEEQLRRRVEELETLMDVTPVPIFVAHDAGCSRISGNRAANELYGTQAGENISSAAKAVRRFWRNGVEIAPSELPMQVAAARNIPVRDYELSIETLSGATLHVFGHASPLRDATGRARGSVGAFVDITALKQAEQGLRRERAQLEATFQALQDGMVVLDMQRNTVLINEVAAHIFGFDSSAEMREHMNFLRSVVELRTPDGGMVPYEVRPASRVLRGEKFADLELLARRPDTAREWCLSFSASPVYDASGEQILAVLMIRDVTEVKLTAKALMESETRYRRFVESCPVGLGIGGIAGDQAGQLSFVNNAFLKIAGYTRQEFDTGLIGWNTITPKEFEAADRAATTEVLEKGVAQPYEKEYIRKDGTRVPVLLALAAIPGNSEVGAFVLDLTELRETRRALEERRSELARRVEEFETLLSVAPVGIAVSRDPRGDDIRVNPMLGNLLGAGCDTNVSLSGPDAQQLPFRILQDGREMAPEGTPQKVAARTGRRIGPVELEVARADGARFCLFGAAAPLFAEDGNVRGSIAAYFDATELRAADAKVRESHTQLKRLVDSNIVGVIVSRGAQVIDANDLFLSMLGYTREEMIAGRVNWQQATASDFMERSMAAVEEVRQRGSCTPFEKEYIRRDGTRVPVYLGAAILTREPELTSICFVVDLTAQKALERELHLANRRLSHSNEELQRFAYVAAHDLQSPLRTIETMTQLLSRRLHGQLDAEDSEVFGHIQTSAQRMQALIADLLEYSRVTGSGTGGKPVDCAALLNGAMENLRTRIRETAAAVTADPLPAVLAGEQLLRVFQNLIDNALKYRGEAAPRIHVAAERSGEAWVISVRDNGIGFDMQYADRIFRVFERLQGAGPHEGTGIGLAICRKLIERYGGRIWAESEPGAGSTFFFSLPAAL